MKKQNNKSKKSHPFKCGAQKTMKQVFYVNHKKVKDNIETQRLIYPCVFENYEDAVKSLLEISANMGYKVKYTEDGHVMCAIFTNRRGVENTITIESYAYAKSYYDFMMYVQSYKSDDD